MRLLKFSAQNLFSLGEVELDLDKRGLVLITGHSKDEGGANGSGKSSLSNKGILWTLFGSTASGERADAAINKFSTKDATCSGTLDVESNNGGKFRIIRSRNPNRLSLIDVATGQDISAKTEKETQVLINTILGRTKETFLQTDFFGQGKLAAFLDLTPRAQVELLETILPFDRLAQLSESAKGFLTKLEVVYASVQRKISEQTGKQMEAQRQERELSTAIDTWDTEHDKKITDLKTKIQTLEASDFNEKLELLKQRAVELPNREDCDRLFRECSEYTEFLTNYNHKLIEAYKGFHKEIASLPPAPVVLGESCPTCLSYITKDMARNLQTRKIQHDHNVARIQLNISEVEQQQKRILEEEKRTKTLEAEGIEALKQIQRFEEEVRAIEASRNSQELAILRKNLADAEAEINPYMGMYEQTSSTLSLIINNLSAHKTRLDEVNKDLHALSFWKDAFGKELKNEFISQVCPFLEKAVKTHLDGLGNPQLRVSITTRKQLKSSSEDRSEFTVSASSSSGGDSYDSLSGGERQIVNFAMGLALADLAELQTDGPSYFMVLDEPFMALDARNSENLVGYLNSYLQNKKETILLVSNEETLKSLIPNRINVIKENGITRIE